MNASAMLKYFDFAVVKIRQLMAAATEIELFQEPVTQILHVIIILVQGHRRHAHCHMPEVERAAGCS